MKYELCYLIGESKEQELPRIKEEVSKIITDEGGQWDELQTEEKRKMAYKVGRDVRGIYVARRFEISKEDEEEGEAKNPIDNINRKMNLYGDVLRFIIVKADELPELKQRETREPVKKDFRKPAYVKKEPAYAAKPVEEKPVAKEEPTSAPEDQKEKIAEEEKKEKSEKSIDEKIDEILNI